MQPERVFEPSSEPRKPRDTRSRGQRVPRRQSDAVVNIKEAGGMVWRGPEYPLLTPGIYTVRGSKVQGPVWVRNFFRWSVRIEFALVHEPGSVSMFLNLGNDKEGQAIKRQSRYYKAWATANGEGPRKGQSMTPEVFLEGQFFEAEVETCDRDVKGNLKPESEWYSRVVRLVSARWP